MVLFILIPDMYNYGIVNLFNKLVAIQVGKLLNPIGSNSIETYMALCDLLDAFDKEPCTPECVLEMRNAVNVYLETGEKIVGLGRRVMAYRNPEDIVLYNNWYDDMNAEFEKAIEKFIIVFNGKC